MQNQAALEDIAGCQSALFEWTDSYDTKDWTRLKECVAPTLRIDYRAFSDKLWEAMPCDEFITMASHPHFLGNPLLRTQHFVGAGTWQKISDVEIMGTHQLRVAHQKYTDVSLEEVAVKSHAHGVGRIWYKKVNGVWKFAGVRPEIRWTEFASQHEVFGDFGKGGQGEDH
ncbi:putative scytalone dehydratase [Lophiotrema nucula]|uniref:Putative scytalone dehydratase n=1 Tax=Lophiotrema nucula TaxID=690887 RepID=A0A6A5ZH77_9PLEO|nr:putative scytalone dehydratase [Lophiotrema nucula]